MLSISDAAISLCPNGQLSAVRRNREPSEEDLGERAELLAIGVQSGDLLAADEGSVSAVQTAVAA